MNNKNKIFKTAIILILVSFFIFLGFTLRKLFIFFDISDKLSTYENMDNVYVKMASSASSSIFNYEKFYKDGVEKQVITNKSLNATVYKFIYPNMLEKTFTDGVNEKVVSIYGDNLESDVSIHSQKLYSYVDIDFITVPELIITCLSTHISTDILNGKDCYVLSSKYNLNFMYDENTDYIKTYIEKDTGLTLQISQVPKLDDNTIENITFEYGFGTVSEEDMKEPNMSEYTLVN